MLFSTNWLLWPLVTLVCLVLSMSWYRWRARRFVSRLIHREAHQHGVKLSKFRIQLSVWWPFDLEIKLYLNGAASESTQIDQMLQVIWDAIDLEFGDADDT